MCDHQLWGEPTGLRCVETGNHTTHSYIATWAPDRHDIENGEDQ